MTKYSYIFRAAAILNIAYFIVNVFDRKTHLLCLRQGILQRACGIMLLYRSLQRCNNIVNIGIDKLIQRRILCVVIAMR